MFTLVKGFGSGSESGSASAWKVGSGSGSTSKCSGSATLLWSTVTVQCTLASAFLLSQPSRQIDRGNFLQILRTTSSLLVGSFSRKIPCAAYCSLKLSRPCSFKAFCKENRVNVMVFTTLFQLFRSLVIVYILFWTTSGGWKIRTIAIMFWNSESADRGLQMT